MPRKKIIPAVEAKAAFRAEIREKRARLDMPQATLATHLDVGPSRMSVLMSNPDALSAARLREIVHVLHPDPVVVLSFLGYTPKDIKELAKSQSV